MRYAKLEIMHSEDVFILFENTSAVLMKSEHTVSFLHTSYDEHCRRICGQNLNCSSQVLLPCDAV
jgi:hypothetical protein